MTGLFHRGLHRVLAAWLVTLALGVLGAEKITEYEAKAAFLYKLGQFIQWPPVKFPSPESPFIIGVLGEDPFGQDLDRTIQGETIEERPVVVRRYREEKEAREAHVLFVSASERRRFPKVFELLKGSHVLTVGEVDGFAEQGGMVQLGKEGRNIRLLIANLRALQQEELKVPANLLALFRRTIPSKP